MIPWIKANLLIVKIVVLLLIIAGIAIAIHHYGSTRYKAGQQIIINGDLKLAQQQEIENGKQLERDKTAIAAALKKFTDLQAQYADVNGDLGSRLGLCLAAQAGRRPVPTPARGAAVAAEPSGVAPTGSEVGQLAQDYVAACGRDAARLTSLQGLVTPGDAAAVSSD